MITKKVARIPGTRDDLLLYSAIRGRLGASSHPDNRALVIREQLPLDPDWNVGSAPVWCPNDGLAKLAFTTISDVWLECVQRPGRLVERTITPTQNHTV
jgi:hypothetical protein